MGGDRSVEWRPVPWRTISKAGTVAMGGNHSAKFNGSLVRRRFRGPGHSRTSPQQGSQTQGGLLWLRVDVT